MKKLLTLLIVLSTMFLLVACDLNGGGISDSTAQKEEIYLLAVESGYSGTYEEWLNSIKGDSIALRVNDGYIQWKYSSSSSWTNLISIQAITGAQGATGKDGKDGKDGKTPLIEIKNGYWYIDGKNTGVLAGGQADTTVSATLTEAEFKAQPAMFGSPWMTAETRMKIVVQVEMMRGTKITFLGDTSVYCWGVMETTDKENASAGSWSDSGWNYSWTNPNEKTYTTTYAKGYFVLTVGKLGTAGTATEKLTQTELNNIHSMFKVEGTKAAAAASSPVVNGGSGAVTLNDSMVSVNHRGWKDAPENTLSAYRESYQQGFKYVECDVQFTKDGVAVLLHDDTIDRTSNGSGTLSQMTYNEVLQYDFGSWKNAKYAGENIPTFYEFISLCKRLELHPYIELKGNMSDEEAKQLIGIVADCNMLDKVSWISFDGGTLSNIAANCPTARIGWVMSDYQINILSSNTIAPVESVPDQRVCAEFAYTLVKDTDNVITHINKLIMIFFIIDYPLSSKKQKPMNRLLNVPIHRYLSTYIIYEIQITYK